MLKGEHVMTAFQSFEQYVSVQKPLKHEARPKFLMKQVVIELLQQQIWTLFYLHYLAAETLYLNSRMRSAINAIYTRYVENCEMFKD